MLIVRTVAPAGLTALATALVLNGPAGTPCSGTLNGQPYSGVQSWTTYNGHGYWACFTRGTSGYGNPKSPPPNHRTAAPGLLPAADSAPAARRAASSGSGEREVRAENGDPVVIRGG